MRTLLLLFLLAAAPVWSQTQSELNQQAQRDYETADKELNAVYKQLMAKLDKASQQRLVDAQLVWIKFRDANATAHAQVNEGGSIYPMIYAGARTYTTRARTAELKEWLEEYR
jgi:uncharacterized protein YecT (DUF1311 family)